MKKLLFFFLIVPLFSRAQPGDKNVIKVNLSSLVVKNFHFIYERTITNHFSVSLGYRYMPNGEVPLKSQLEKAIDDPNINISSFRMGNSAFTPEVRLYLGKGRMNGFYIAPYARFATFDVTVPVQYQNSSFPSQNREALFSGKVKSTSGGLMFGVQRNLLKFLKLDIWMIGGHYGTCDGTLNATNINPPMDASERADLDNELSNLDVEPFKASGQSTSATSAFVTVSGPWVGVRIMGITVGLKF
jgi:hypothetical protein